MMPCLVLDLSPDKTIYAVGDEFHQYLLEETLNGYIAVAGLQSGQLLFH